MSRTTAVRSAPSNADRPRWVAFETLQSVQRDDAYANLLLPRLIVANGLQGRDAALATELAYGTLRAGGTLDEIIRRCSIRELAETEPAVLIVLRLGAYQLLRTRIPPHAAVASSVDLARTTGNGRAAGFVNAVLRKVAGADYDAWCDRIAEHASPLGALALRYSHPGWIVAAFSDALKAESLKADSLEADALATDSLAVDSPAEDSSVPDSFAAGRPTAGESEADGIAELERALSADDARPETHLVAWPGRISRTALAEQSAGEPGPFSPYAVRLSGGGEPGSFEAVRSGSAGVQDEGSQLSAIALTALPLTGPDERWLDLCAGPGGKAALLGAIAAQRGATVTAIELHPHRAELVRNSTAGWPIEVITADARELAADGRGFDRVLLDAPCTGLGALRRRPEARWRRTPQDLDGLTVLQAELLDAAVRLARPGGVIGYVTCSPHLAETREQVTAVIERHPDLELLDARPAFTADYLGNDATVQLWPHRHGTDGMFFAALRRSV